LNRARTPIPFAGSHFSDYRHVCAFFNSDEEEYRVLLPFIKDGLHSGERAVHVVNPEQREEHLRRLVSEGVDTSATLKSGQLELKNDTDTYLRDGLFDKERMIKVFEQMASGNDSGGFPSSRIICRMDLGANSAPRNENLSEVESRINDVWCRHDDIVICTYHLSKFGGETVIDIMRTHPMVIIGGILQQNPFFVPPQEFLPELRRRRASRTAA